jgi:hypothetical protein
MKSSRSFVLNNSGQGLIEYVLILVVSTTIVLGALYQLNRAFRVFADNYFGDYLTCLLESGELPGLGGNAPGECNQQYKEFSIADGRPLVGDGVGSGSGDGEGANGAETADEASRARAVSRGGAQRFSAGSSSFSRSGRFGRSSPRGAGAGDAESSSDMSSEGASGYVSAGASSSSSTKTIRIPIRYSDREINGRRVKEKNDEKKTMKVAAKTEESPEVQRQRLLPVKRRLASTEEAPDIEEFTFGNFLKYLIIAIIIIAIVVIVGGELRQVSKSMK